MIGYDMYIENNPKTALGYKYTMSTDEKENADVGVDTASDSDSVITLDHLTSYRVLYRSGRELYPVIKPYAMYCYNASGLYLFWICLHYVAANMYTYYCVPTFFQGFFMSPFLVSAPHCRAIRWVVHNGGNTIDNMWVMLATWLCSRLVMRVSPGPDTSAERKTV